MARVYTNENFPRPAAEELRRLGHDVLTVQEAGYSGRAVSDEQVLDFATGQERAVITLNRKHFLRLHQEQPAHSGIIVAPLIPTSRGKRTESTMLWRGRSQARGDPSHQRGGDAAS